MTGSAQKESCRVSGGCTALAGLGCSAPTHPVTQPGRWHPQHPHHSSVKITSTQWCWYRGGCCHRSCSDGATYKVIRSMWCMVWEPVTGDWAQYEWWGNDESAQAGVTSVTWYISEKPMVAWCKWLHPHGPELVLAAMLWPCSDPLLTMAQVEWVEIIEPRTKVGSSYITYYSLDHSN